MARFKIRRLLTGASLLSLLVGPGTGLTQVTDLRDSILASDIRVIANPYGIAPLTAVATFQTTGRCIVQVRVLGETEISKTFAEEGTSHAIPILGLYPDRVNTVLLRITAADRRPETTMLYIQTEPLPDFFPEIEITRAVPDRMEPGLISSAMTVTVGSDRPMYPMVFDRNGVVRWYLDISTLGGLAAPFERISNGNFLGGIGASTYEYDPLGQLVDRMTFAGYNFHHDIRELPNGHFVACVDQKGTTIVNSRGLIASTGDVIVEIDPRARAIVNSWDMRQILDVDRNEQVNSTGDWFHMNALWFSPDDNCLIVSGRHQGIVKVTWENRLKWILSPHKGWGNAGPDGSGPPTAPFLLTAVDPAGRPYASPVQDGGIGAADFDWGWGQHNPSYLPNGNLLLFDNGDFRYFLTNFPKFSRAVEIRLDETAMTVQQIWEYGKERGAETYSRIISSVDTLPLTQNRQFAPGIVQTAAGTYAKVIEVTYPDNQVVFEATIHFKNLLAPPGTAVGDNVYRSHRISIYP